MRSRLELSIRTFACRVLLLTSGPAPHGECSARADAILRARDEGGFDTIAEARAGWPCPLLLLGEADDPVTRTKDAAALAAALVGNSCFEHDRFPLRTHLFLPAASLPGPNDRAGIPAS